jgi:hypothetical protein
MKSKFLGNTYARSRIASGVKSKLILALIFLTVLSTSGMAFAVPASAAVTDYSLTVDGPHHVVQGHNLFFNVISTVITGTDDEQVTTSISGVPTGATGVFVDQLKYCCGATLYRLAGTNPVEISTTGATPVGTYTLTVTYLTNSGTKRSVSFTLYVDPVPGPLAKVTPPPDVPLASLADWQSNMTNYGMQHCNTTEATSIYQGYAWYYDGPRVFYQIGDYTGDHATWDACAALFLTGAYRQYVLQYNGAIPGYMDFPKGFAMDYQRTGSTLSKQALGDLATNGLYSAVGSDLAYKVNWISSRETAYAFDSLIANESIGAPRQSDYNDLVDLILGHFNQWFVDKSTTYVQSFMVALSSEALIDYYAQSNDPRIPPMLQLAADQMWANNWDPVGKGFNYYNDDGSIDAPTLQDLNF